MPADYRVAANDVGKDEPLRRDILLAHVIAYRHAGQVTDPWDLVALEQRDSRFAECRSRLMAVVASTHGKASDAFKEPIPSIHSGHPEDITSNTQSRNIMLLGRQLQK